MAEKPKKPATLVGIEIENVCPCGEKVEPYERQLVVWHPDREKWNRMCVHCINNDARFVEPKSDTPLSIVARNSDASFVGDGARADLQVVAVEADPA